MLGSFLTQDFVSDEEEDGNEDEEDEKGDEGDDDDEDEEGDDDEEARPKRPIKRAAPKPPRTGPHKKCTSMLCKLTQPARVSRSSTNTKRSHSRPSGSPTGSLSIATWLMCCFVRARKASAGGSVHPRSYMRPLCTRLRINVLVVLVCALRI